MTSIPKRAAVALLSTLMIIALATGHAVADDEQSYSVRYYHWFVGYDLPLRLTDETTKEEAETNAAKAAYYIGYFDADGKLARVVKMWRGDVMFEQRYTYYPNGKLKRLEGKNGDGTARVSEFDEAGKKRR